MGNIFNIMTSWSKGWRVAMKMLLYGIIMVIAFAGCAEDSLVFPVIDHVDLIRNSIDPSHPSVTFYTIDTLDFQLTGHDGDGDTSTLYVDTYDGDYLTGTIIAQNNFPITSGKSISYTSVSPFITTNTIGNYCLKFVLRDREGNESFPYVISYQVTNEPRPDSSPAHLSTIDFGSVSVGSQGGPVTVTITNIGTGNLEMSILRFTGSDSSSGYQIWGFSAAKFGTYLTGLNDDATVYTCTITVDGDVVHKQAISVVGSYAQTIDDLCVEIQSDLNGATCTFFEDPDNRIVIKSNTTGKSSRILIEDTDLFSSLTDINPIAETPVDGADHQFNESNDDVSLKTIGPAGFETVDITFDPKTTGSFNAVLEIPNNHVYLSPLQIYLTGVGTP